MNRQKLLMISVLVFAFAFVATSAFAALTFQATSVTSDGALTITGAAASTWSTSAGALTVDSAAALNLGTTNATSLSVGATGITTTNNGALTVTQTLTANGTVVLGDAAADLITVNATVQGASPFVFEGLTANDFELTFAIPDVGADATITFPSATSTLYGTAADSITSAQMLSSVTNETGTGSLVFATSPTLVTPALGAATATSVAVGGGTALTKITVASLADDASGWVPDGAATDFTITASAASIAATSHITVSVGANATAATCGVYTKTAATSFKVKCSAAPANAATLEYMIVN